MKLIKKAQVVKVSLNEQFKVGQQIKVTKGYHDGRGGYDSAQFLYTIVKVNRVTIDISDEEGNIFRYDPVWGGPGRTRSAWELA